MTKTKSSRKAPPKQHVPEGPELLEEEPSLTVDEVLYASLLLVSQGLQKPEVMCDNVHSALMELPPRDCRIRATMLAQRLASLQAACRSLSGVLEAAKQR